uniref:Uncharacterized protein n=1 Tax=Anguilla anguilla TaxID=7936 RepID=A0A0E9T344_ANGAN
MPPLVICFRAAGDFAVWPTALLTMVMAEF